jgi:hypothetical protein
VIVTSKDSLYYLQRKLFFEREAYINRACLDMESRS